MYTPCIEIPEYRRYEYKFCFVACLIVRKPFLPVFLLQSSLNRSVYTDSSAYSLRATGFKANTVHLFVPPPLPPVTYTLYRQGSKV